jgi:hypothetical protein
VYNKILEQHTEWKNAMSSAEVALSAMTGSDATVYGLRLHHSRVTVKYDMQRTSTHYEGQNQDEEKLFPENNTLSGNFDEDGNRIISEDEQENELETTDELPNKKCSTPFYAKQQAPERKQSVTFGNDGQDSFANGLKGNSTRVLGSMKSKINTGWEEQSYLDQDTLLDNLTSRKSKKVNWDDFYSKNHSKRYYCPDEKRGNNEYKSRFTFSGRVAADWPQTKKIITTMILTRRYMNFDEKLMRLQEMMTDKAAFMIKDADQDEDGLIYALRVLENEFGGYEDTETALVQKLGSLEPMDINNTVTIDNYKFSVIQLVKLIQGSGRNYKDHEVMILATQRFEPQTRML